MVAVVLLSVAGLVLVVVSAILAAVLVVLARTIVLTPFNARFRPLFSTRKQKLEPQITSRANPTSGVTLTIDHTRSDVAFVFVICTLVSRHTPVSRR